MVRKNTRRICGLIVMGVTAWVGSSMEEAWAAAPPGCAQPCDRVDPCYPSYVVPSVPGGEMTPRPEDDTATPPSTPLTTPQPSPLSAPSTPSSTPPAFAMAQQSGAGLGATFAVPHQLGDNFGGAASFAILPIRTFSAQGSVLNGFPGGTGAEIAFEVGNDLPPNDFYSVGQGRIIPGGDPMEPHGIVVYAISEPVPPSDAPALPPNYAGGEAAAPEGFDSTDDWTVTYYSRIVIPDPGGGGAGAVIGRLKIAENNSPIPQDRIFFNYSMFDNVPLVTGGTTVNRFSPGFEKTFLGGLMSVEARFPFASTLDTNVYLGGPNELSNVAFGNIMLALKGLLVATDTGAISAGLAMTVPTADDMNYFLADGTPLLSIDNESVHLMPFLGWLKTHNRFFTTGFLQLDVDANGSPVAANLANQGLAHAGVIQDETYMYLDIATGFWLWQADPACRNCSRLTGIAPVLEMHYNRSLTDSDVITVGTTQLGTFQEDIQLLNMVMGCHFQLGPRSTFTCGYTTPIGNGSDQQFDGEIRAIFNRYF